MVPLLFPLEISILQISSQVSLAYLSISLIRTNKSASKRERLHRDINPNDVVTWSNSSVQRKPRKHNPFFYPSGERTRFSFLVLITKTSVLDPFRCQRFFTLVYLCTMVQLEITQRFQRFTSNLYRKKSWLNFF